MNKVRAAAEHLKDLEAYDPRYLPARIYLNANENPYGMPEQAREEFLRSVSEEALHRYPDPLAKRLRATLAQKLGVDDECVLLGNGGDELLFDICLAYGGVGRCLLSAPPTFSVYNTDAILTQTQVVEIARKNEVSKEGLLDFRVNEAALLDFARQNEADIIMLTSPNNPTGDCLPLAFIEELLNATDALVLIDQAYIEFAAPGNNALRLFKEHTNLALLYTFSKAYSLAGLRIGYLVAHKEVTHELCKVRQPYSVDALAALAALAALKEEAAVEQQVAAIRSERERLARLLGKEGLGLLLAPSEANFLLVRVPRAHEVWQQLYDEYGILVRDLSLVPGLEDCLRISIGTPEENDELVEALSTIGNRS